MNKTPLSARRVPELLAPAGTVDAFKAALAGGADAIYCGLGVFNARRNAENLDLEQFEQLCRLAHLAGTRVYVTVNILIADDEFPRALSLVHDCHLAGADAFIMADWGLIRYVSQLWPQIEIHLSTQANVNDPCGVALAREMGCSRVTLSREMTLGEIESCAGLGVDLEVFAHGAICVSYSGECLLSSMQRGRSANRGLCRQPCRLPYRIVDETGADLANVNGTRLLSPRDNCTIDDIEALSAAGCSSMKLEGRMKAPDYVATVTSAYRRALDEFACGGSPSADETVMRALARSFNRDFTDGYLHGRCANDFMSYERGNNRGQLSGTVKQAKAKSALLALFEPVDEGDLLEIRNPDKFDDYVTVPSPRTVEAPCELLVQLPRAMGAGCEVRVIRSERGMAQAREFSSRTWPWKRPVCVKVEAKLGEPFRVTLRCAPASEHPDMPKRTCQASAEGPLVESARTRSVSPEDLRDHVGRFGSTPFEAAEWQIELDEGIGISFATVHAVRAQAAEKLCEAILKPWSDESRKIPMAPCGVVSSMREVRKPSSKPLICALVTNPCDARVAIEAGADMVYAPSIDLALGAFSSGLRRSQDGCEPQSWPEGIVALLPEVSRTKDHEYSDSLIEGGVELACGTVSWLKMASDKGARPWVWVTVPLHNRYAYEAMEELGAEGAWLSPELDMLEIANLAKQTRLELGMLVGAHLRTMTTEHCLLQSLGDCAQRCAACPRRKKHLTLVDEFDRPSLVSSDATGRSRVWQSEYYDATPQISELISLGVSRFMVDCRMSRKAKEVESSVRRACAARDAALAGKQAAPRLQGAVSGHLFERIG